MFTLHGGDLYTSIAVLDAEARLVAAARRPTRTLISSADIDRALAAATCWRHSRSSVAALVTY